MQNCKQFVKTIVMNTFRHNKIWLDFEFIFIYRQNVKEITLEVKGNFIVQCTFKYVRCCKVNLFKALGSTASNVEVLLSL